MGRMSGMLLADYIGQVLERRRHSRASPPPRKPPYANFHGGERYYLVLISLSLLAGNCCNTLERGSKIGFVKGETHFKSTSVQIAV
jgi:hypothetical protein